MEVHQVTDSKKGINIDRPTWESLSRKELHLEQWYDHRPDNTWFMKLHDQQGMGWED